MSDKVWAYSNTGMKIHAFAEDSGTGHRQALCSPRITRPASAIYQTTEDVHRSPLCTRCEKKDGERRARIEASMEPVNPYDQVCEGVEPMTNAEMVQAQVLGAKVMARGEELIFEPVPHLRAAPWIAKDGSLSRYSRSEVTVEYPQPEGVKDDEDTCPNGQDRDECSETDPCESCWQDQQEEGDMIEESMGFNAGAPAPSIAEALREDALHDARAEGFTEGAEFVPTPENRWRKGVEKVVIERLWASKTDGHVAVSFDIYNTADWQGRPYKTSSALALDLFRDLYRKPKPEGFDDTVVQALRKLRGFARDNQRGPFADLVDAIDTLDNAGVFAAVDEQTGYDVDPTPEVVWSWSANVRAEDGDRVLRALTGSVRARTRDGAHADVLEHNNPGGEAYLSDIRVNKA